MSRSAGRLTEAQFQRQILQLARLYGWRTLHIRPGLTRAGKWVTAVAGDGKGFPDTVLVRDRVLFVELKVGRGKPTAEQVAWLEALKRAGAEAYLWRPEQWDEITTILGGVR